MMGGFTHWLKPYLPLSPTCDEILSWMFEIWIENHVISDSNRNTVKSTIPKKVYKGMTNYVGLTFSVGDTILRFTISIEQDTKYHILHNALVSYLSPPLGTH